jgi:3',5'-cyclic AMP phosphodiesterase CpdA
MKIQYASDLHLEYKENKAYLNENALPVIGDVLLLAGDIVPFAKMDEHKDFFSFLSDSFAATYWVPGNHEYYHYNIANKMGEIFESIKKKECLSGKQYFCGTRRCEVYLFNPVDQY